jgi:hypothetical protein
VGFCLYIEKHCIQVADSAIAILEPLCYTDDHVTTILTEDQISITLGIQAYPNWYGKSIPNGEKKSAADPGK